MVLSSLAAIHQEKSSENVTGGDETEGVVASSRLRCGGGGGRKESGRTDRYVTSQSLFTLVHDDSTSSLFAFLPTATFVLVALTARASIMAF